MPLHYHSLISSFCRYIISGGIGNQWENWDYPKYRIAKISRNTEKSLGDLRRLAVTQIPVKTRQLTLVWKTCKEYKYSLDTKNILWRAQKILYWNWKRDNKCKGDATREELKTFWNNKKVWNENQGGLKTWKTVITLKN